jgi:hypothetical protein
LIKAIDYFDGFLGNPFLATGIFSGPKKKIVSDNFMSWGLM